MASPARDIILRRRARFIASAVGLTLSSPIGEIKIPRSWFIPSDGLLDFILHNDLAEVHNRKYDETDRVRLEYPHLVQLFKNSFFSAEMIRGLTVVLDELEGRPIIVRSSSLLEDRLGAVADAREAAVNAMDMIRSNFRAAIGINSALFVAASAGSLSPIVAAVLHNGTTLALLGRALSAGTFSRRRVEKREERRTA